MGQTIKLTAADGVAIGAYRAEPAGEPRGGVVVLQEIFGVNPHIRRVADGFAARGYLAVAPALFDRAEPGVELDYTPDDMPRGIAMVGQVGHEKTMLDVAAAVKAAAEGGKVGVVGYCWGGSLAYAAACSLDGVAAAVGYYGGNIAKSLDHRPKVPVMLHFGERDDHIPMRDIEAIRTALPDVPVFTYPAGHGFNCDARGSYTRRAPPRRSNARWPSSPGISAEVDGEVWSSAMRPRLAPPRRPPPRVPDRHRLGRFRGPARLRCVGRPPGRHAVMAGWVRRGCCGVDADSVVRASRPPGPMPCSTSHSVSDLTKLVREGQTRGLFEDRSVVSFLTGEPEGLHPLENEAPEGWIVTAERISFDSPFDRAQSRTVDHQSTLGILVGRTAQRNNRGVMTKSVCRDGAEHLPSDADVKPKRPAA